QVEPAVAQRLPTVVGEPRRLERDSPLENRGQRSVEVALHLDELDALDAACGLGVAEVREEPHPVALDEQRRVRALEAAQVEDVRLRRDEQRVLDALL